MAQAKFEDGTDNAEAARDQYRLELDGAVDPPDVISEHAGIAVAANDAFDQSRHGTDKYAQRLRNRSNDLQASVTELNRLND